MYVYSECSCMYVYSENKLHCIQWGLLLSMLDCSLHVLVCNNGSFSN